MDISYIRHELEALARFLDLAYMPQTAKAVRDIQPAAVVSPPDEKSFSPVLDAYREEVLDSLNILGEPDLQHHKALLEGMDSLLVRMASKPQQSFSFLSDKRALLEAIGESHGNTRELYRSFASVHSSNKQVYLNLCLMYLILCEGVFTNLATILLGLYSIGNGTSLATPQRTARLSKTLQTLDQIGLGAFSAGYSRHVRNAIAHGHFKYDSRSREMRFRDFTFHDSVTLVFDEVWPFEKFAWHYAKLDDVYWLVSTYLQVHFLSLLAH